MYNIYLAVLLIQLQLTSFHSTSFLEFSLTLVIISTIMQFVNLFFSFLLKILIYEKKRPEVRALIFIIFS
ncbi:hypothetical protein ABE29_14980 [Cytobacillus firmus]|nr:hypothetical protein [Cytobacillus firmus]MBG9549491.1 hypothetical protein [Cytobacillus firmus]MBG9550902.1 hypothetical protein [Cytobacillus firmus]MBG9559521.1 hypothetical protein [Cytobacillus firmus]MBG9574615.1 hypothetical protein [Cytobacillus firmus]